MTFKNLYDTIMGDIRKEKSTMIQKPIWETQQYSKSEINNAAKIFLSSSSNQERDASLKIIDNWRAVHAYPLNTIYKDLIQQNPNAIVAQRLKRLDSIINKIERFPDMQLYKIQDLGGARVILDTIDDVYETVEKYKCSTSHTNIFKREYDYINNPKESGYRSYHMVYQYQDNTNDTYNKNIFIEIQVRTKLQHIWATAVEMMGLYTRSNLKSSQGNKDILKFLTLASSIFALKERMPVCPNTSDNINDLIYELAELDNKHNILFMLKGLSVSMKDMPLHIDDGYYLLSLDYNNMEIYVAPFNENDLPLATRAYNELEKRMDKTTGNVVLVATNKFDTLKEAYPNYFADINNFVSIMIELLKY